MRAQDLSFACRPCTVARSLIHRGLGDTSHSHLLGAMIYGSYSCLVLDVNSVVIIRNSLTLGQEGLLGGDVPKQNSSYHNGSSHFG